MYQRGKKLLSMVLVLCMVVGLMPLTAQAALLEGEEYITQQLYLGEDIVLHLRGDIPESYRSATAVITFCGESKSCTISDLTQDENGLYDMAVEVDVAEMTENIGLKATYLGLTAIEENYSVAQYLKTLISGNYTNQTKFLALELLNYGAAAQNYFDYNTDNLATAGGYEYAPSNAVPDDVPTVLQSGSVDGIRLHAASVRLLSETAVRFYFEADSVDGLTFTVDGKQYTPDSNDTGYFIEVTGINPQDMDNEMTVEVTDGTDTLSVKYAPIYYFIRTYHNTENEELKNLAAAAYSYFVAANNFVGVEPTGDFVEGVHFDNPGNVQLFSGVGGEDAWRDALLEIVSVDDNNVLKLTCASSQWPVFRMNFGKTLKAGTAIDFRAYITDITNADKSGSVSLFEGMPNEAYLVYSKDRDATAEYRYNTWTDLTIVLAEDREYVDLVCNMDRANSITCTNIEVYMDDFKAYEPVEISGDILEGLNFEDAGNALWFTGTGNASADATIRRVSYTDANVSAPANGGEYALKVSHASNCWPNFRLNFGKTLKAGTTITFDVYGNYDYAAAEGVNKYVKLELAGDSKNYATSEDPNQVLWTLVETWRTGVAITLTADCDHVDFFYNVADGSHGEVSSWLLLDNVKAVEPLVFTGDFETGVGLEDAGDIVQFTETGSGQDATIERATYTNAGVSAPANGGSYALKVSHASNCWPTFRVNFGKTLKAGTTITFDVYGNYDYVAPEGVNKYMKLELAAGSKSFATSEDPNQVVWTLVETWRTVTITLTAETDYVDFMYNVADGQHGDSLASWMLLDNFKAVEPVLISEGLNFDDANEVNAFEALTDGVMFETTSVDGNNVLKASHANNCWPNFRLNFGKTLKAGTTITFDVYGNYDYEAAEGVTKYVKLELTGDSKNYATTADPNQVVWTVVETWQTATITLTADSDHVDFFYNVADGNHGEVFSWIFMDNFKAEEPVVISNGLSFDNNRDAELFTGIAGQEWRNAAVEIVSLDGNNVLKLSCSSSAWPTFRINFGETLKAGTTITFNVYGNYDYEAAEGVTKYVKLELSGDSKNVATSEDPNQVLWTVVETWRTVTITLTADCDYLEFYYNVADGQHGESPASWIMLDEFVVVKP